MNQVGGPLICTTGASVSAQRRLYRGWAAGDYHKLAPGHFIDARIHRELSATARVQVRIVAWACTAPKTYVIGSSASLLWGFPEQRSHGQCLGAPVELGRSAGRTVHKGNVHYRALRREHSSRTRLMDTGFGIVQVTDRLTTCLDLARWNSLDDAVHALDHCLQKKWFTLGKVDSRVQEMGGAKGIDDIRQAALLASAGSESPRETKLKLLMWRLGLPAPLQQVNITSRRGTWLGRVDFFYPGLGLIIEYDGQGKYDLPATDGRSVKEKEYDQTVEYLANGLSIVRVRKEHLSNGLAAEIIVEQVRTLSGKGLSYPDHLWSGGVPAWRTG